MKSLFAKPVSSKSSLTNPKTHSRNPNPCLSVQSSRMQMDHCVIDVEELPQPEEFRKWRMGQVSNSAVGKKELLRKRLATKCIHSVPLIVLFCFFALWKFSAPANLVIKDGRIEAHDIMMPLALPFNGTHVELASLASATPPVISVSQNLTRHNGTETYLIAELKKHPKKEVRLKSY